MPVAAMNHFTVLSDDLEATRRFYCDLFGFKVGWRPPSSFRDGGFMPTTTSRFCT
jgi:catechol 2,3-dioxygenase-like lactoylglutathione lyase family enzyme